VLRREAAVFVTVRRTHLRNVANMRMFRSSVSLAILAGLAVGSHAVAGCGGDDAPASTAVDAGTTGADANVTPSPPADGGAPAGPVLTISESRAKIYLGQTARVDGAAVAPNVTTDLVWTVVAAPNESAIATASIQGANTATPTFVPDRLGSYTLQLSGKKDGATTSVLVFIEAIDAPVFWRDLHITSDGSAISGALSTRVGGLHGTAPREIGCARALDPDAGGSQFETMLIDTRLGATAGDTWEAPPGQPSRVVFPVFTIVDNTSRLVTSLGVATSQSKCGAPEAKSLEPRDVDAGLENADIVMHARFSPDGNRIAYLRSGLASPAARIATIGFDGTGQRNLSPFVSTPDGGPGDGGLDRDASVTLASGGPLGFILGPVGPRWRDATHVGFLTFVGPTANSDARDTWELYEVADEAGAAAALKMTCTGSAVSHFDYLSDGTIVAATRHGAGVDGGPPPVNLVVYRANATTKACEVVRNLTNYASGGLEARDFALSPDKTKIAFFADDRLATVPVDGSSAPAFVPGSPAAGADPGIGPRWVAGGTAITWGQRRFSQGGIPMGLGGVMTIAAAGGTTRSLAEGHFEQANNGGGSQIDYQFTYGFGQGCSAAPGGVGSTLAIGGIALGAAALVHRRRKSRSSSRD
jgi:hypothetical protein